MNTFDMNTVVTIYVTILIAIVLIGIIYAISFNRVVRNFVNNANSSALEDSSVSLSVAQVSQIIERAIAKGGHECYLIFYTDATRKYMTPDQANRGIEKLLSAEEFPGDGKEHKYFNPGILHCAKSVMSTDQIKRTVDKMMIKRVGNLECLIKDAPEHLDRILNDSNSIIYKSDDIYSVLKFRDDDFSELWNKIIDKIIDVRTDAYQLLVKSINITSEQKRKVVAKWVEQGDNLEDLVRGLTYKGGDLE